MPASVDALEVLNDREKLVDVVAACGLSTKIGCKALFPERFNLPFSGMHGAAFALLDDPSLHRVAIAAPRSFGKTSIVGVAYPALELLYQRHKFIVIISSTAPNAVMMSENLKIELKTNENILRIFGSVRPLDVETPFSKELWVTDTGIVVMPRGYGQQVRGLIYEMARPTLIIVDDFEDDESVRSEEQRQFRKEWVYSAVLNSVDMTFPNWKVVVIGTILHEASFLSDIIKDTKNWASIRLEICDDNLESNWVEKFSKSDLEALYRAYEEQGLLDVFFREYRNLAVATGNRKFTEAMFKYYDPLKMEPLFRDMETVVLIDPAKTSGTSKSDFTSIVGVSIDRYHSAVYVRDIVNARLTPGETIDEMIEMCIRLKADAIGIEITGLGEYATWPLMNELCRRDLPYQMIELNARGNKNDRIAALIPLYRRGMVFHNEAVCKGLETQLLSYPRSRFDDIMDGFAYVVGMLDEGGVTFSPPEPTPGKNDLLPHLPLLRGWRCA